MDRDMVRAFHMKHGFPLDQRLSFVRYSDEMFNAGRSFDAMAHCLNRQDCTPSYRVHLIAEETAELAHAFLRRDLIAVADAIGDIMYVTIGTAETFGLPWVEILQEVHRSNMTKQVRRPGNERMRDKGPDYEPPNIVDVLAKGRNNDAEKLTRWWINAPSTHDDCHKFHGLRVIGPLDKSQSVVTVYPVTGEAWSMMIESRFLSFGWPDA